MKVNSEYEKVCPYCGNQFEANHLSRIYCSEACKRHMFRKRLQDKRKLQNSEADQFKRNDSIIKSFTRNGSTKVTTNELIKAGFDEKCYLKKFIFDHKWLILYENCLLEVMSDKEYIIHLI